MERAMIKSVLACVAIAARLLAIDPQPAAAQAVEYAYTQFDADKCRHTRGRDVEDYGSWLCPGYEGIPVRLSAGDQRMYVSFGRNAAKEVAAGETFPGFNSAYKGTIEWRLERRPDGSLRPFATILRWHVMTPEDTERADGKSTGQTLAITRLGPGGVCHVGYVDGRAPNANERARKIADEHARTFKCGKDKAE
jgi:hypothetical protein